MQSRAIFQSSIRISFWKYQKCLNVACNIQVHNLQHWQQSLAFKCDWSGNKSAQSSNNRRWNERNLNVYTKFVAEGGGAAYEIYSHYKYIRIVKHLWPMAAPICRLASRQLLLLLLLFVVVASSVVANCHRYADVSEVATSMAKQFNAVHLASTSPAISRATMPVSSVHRCLTFHSALSISFSFHPYSFHNRFLWPIAF